MPKRALRAVDDDAVRACWRGQRRAPHRACSLCSRISCSSGGSGQRMLRPSGGMSKSVGQSRSRRGSGSTSTEAELSIVSAITLNADPAAGIARHRPAIAGRDRGTPARPTGFRTGIMASMKAYSLWCAVVEDLQVWSSPASTSTPPWRDVPARLPCCSTSPERSTPGPLPYQMANTPSYLLSPNRCDLLRAPDRGGGQVLVDAGLELDVVVLRGTSAPATAPGRSRPAASRDSRR